MAIETYERMPNPERDSFPGQFILAAAKIQMHERDEGYRLLEDSIERSSARAEAFELTGELCARDFDFERARRFFKSALTIDSERPLSRLKVALIDAQEAGDSVAAKTALEKAATSPGVSLDTLLAFALLETQLSRETTTAEDLFSTMVTRGEQQDVMYAIRGQYFTSIAPLFNPPSSSTLLELPEELERARDILTEGMEKHPKNAVLTCLMSEWYFTAYRYVKFTSDTTRWTTRINNMAYFAEKTLTLDPFYWPARMTPLALDRPFPSDRRIPILEKGVELHPYMIGFYTGLAREYAGAGSATVKSNPHRAIELSRQLLSLQPTSCDGHMIMGCAFRLLKAFDQAVQHLHTACELQEQWVEPRLQLAEAYLLSGDYDTSCDVLRKVRAMNPDGTFKNWLESLEGQLNERRSRPGNAPKD